MNRSRRQPRHCNHLRFTYGCGPHGAALRSFTSWVISSGEGLIENRPELVAAVRPLLEARKAIEQQVEDLDRKVHKLARRDVQVRRFMTVPGVGPITALCFKATIDDPTRFKRSRSVGACHMAVRCDGAGAGANLSSGMPISGTARKPCKRGLVRRTETPRLH